MDIKRNAKLVRQKYREYLIPAVFTSAALALASVVDAAIVGNLLGTDELAGVGACSPIIAIMNAIFLLFSIGGATKASIALGERKKKKADEYFSVTLIIGLIIAAIFIVVMELAAGPVTALLSRGDTHLSSVMIGYYRPLVFVLPMILIAIGVPQFMRIDGHPKMASYIAVVANVINLILDYVLIRYVGMGLVGASLSTCLGYLFGSALVIPWFVSKKRSFHLVNPFKTELVSNLKDIFSGGSSSFLINISDAFKRMIMNMIVLYYLGNFGLSVLTVCNSLQFFAKSLLKGGAEAFLPIVGTLYGEKDYYGIKKCVLSALKYVIAFGVVILVVMVIEPDLVGRLFGLACESEKMAEYPIRALALSVPFLGVNLMLQTLYNTTGRTKLSSTISVLNGVAYVCFFALLLSMISAKFFWLSFGVAEIMVLFTTMIFGVFIRRKEKITGMLLLKPLPPDTEFLSYTIEADSDSAVTLSKEVVSIGQKLGLDSALTNRMAVAVEEMAVAVSMKPKKRKKEHIIDVWIEKNKKETVLSFRQNGKPINLLQDDPDNPRSPDDGIEVFKRMSKSVEYTRQLGFNTIVAKF